MNKKKIIIGTILTIIIIYIFGLLLFSQKVMPNTKFSDNSASMISKDSLDKVVEGDFGEQTITIKDDVIVDYNPKLSDLGAKIDSEALAQDIETRQNPLMWPVNLFANQNYDLTEYITVDEEILNGKLASDKLVGESGRTKSENASTYFDENTNLYAIKDEVYGTVLDDKFVSDLATAITKGETEFDATKYYKQPSVKASDLEKNITSLNDRLKRKVKIAFGSDTFEVPVVDVATFISLNDEGKVDIDNTTLYNYLSDLASEYTTVSTTDGHRVITSYEIDNAYYQIEEQLLSDESGDINVEGSTQTIKQAAGQTSMPTSTTYIEVSISQQHMWLYNNNELIVSTPVVTGNISKGRGTPTGTFSVWSKETDKVLDGSTVGYDYKVPVDYWMAIDYTGVGIHDIDYLNSGNAEEKSSNNSLNGSHGCINTPDDLMETVYNNTPLGTPVYVME